MTFLKNQTPSVLYKIQGELTLKSINVSVTIEITENYSSLNVAKTRAKVLATQLNIKCVILDNNGELVEEFDYSHRKRTGAGNSTETPKQ